MSYEYIVDPITHKKHKTDSPLGREILIGFIKYKVGGQEYQPKSGRSNTKVKKKSSWELWLGPWWTEYAVKGVRYAKSTKKSREEKTSTFPWLRFFLSFNHNT
tara:strand:- start:10 stop:318 length:309 start_codon:yes stop_codon:yes gene_type:complete